MEADLEEEEALGKDESTDEEEETEEMKRLREEKEASAQKKEWADVMKEQEQAYGTCYFNRLFVGVHR